MSTATLDMEAGEKRQAGGGDTGVDRPGLARWIVQPILVVVAVVACLIYVQVASVSEVEERSVGVGVLLPLLGQHLFLSVVATAIVVIIAVPLGIALTRGPARKYSRPVMIVAGFGQAAPAIGLIALAGLVIGFGRTGVIVALSIYGILPVVANTVAGLDSVDPRLVEASRGMGMSGWATLLRVELPLAITVIVAGIRTALVLIVGTASLAQFVGGGGLGSTISTGIQLDQKVTLYVGATLVAALALFIDWLARLVELAVAPKGLK